MERGHFICALSNETTVCIHKSKLGYELTVSCLFLQPFQNIESTRISIRAHYNKFPTYAVFNNVKYFRNNSCIKKNYRGIFVDFLKLTTASHITNSSEHNPKHTTHTCNIRKHPLHAQAKII